MKNEWSQIAEQEKKIQDIKNRVLNPKLLALIKQNAEAEASVFDYGCGWGEFADILAGQEYRVQAFDESDDMVARAREQFDKPTFFTRNEFYEKLPELAGAFDIVVSNLVLCILNKKDQAVMLKNISRLLKSDGVFVLSFCHPCLDYITAGIVSKRIRPYTHLPRYDQEFKYRKVVHENGIAFDDYHRPLEYYIGLFQKHAYQILDIAESDTLGTEFYPDFIAFALKKS